MPTNFCLKGIIFLCVLSYLLTGCSKYDERSALAPALYFENDNKSIVFTIVKYGKTVSYQQEGGITTKHLNTNYFIQSNDAVTGELIANKKIIHSSKVKFYPVSCIGQSHGKAWVFIGELLSYDPFTLEKIADKEIIQAKNPVLNGKMPDEKRYYEYNSANNEILITATDGIKYSLSTSSLLTKVINEDEISTSGTTTDLKELNDVKKALDAEYQENSIRFRSFNKLYRDKKISSAAYRDSSRNFDQQQDAIREKRNQIQNKISAVEKTGRNNNYRQRQIEDLHKGSKSYNSICTAVDTFNGKWYGLLSRPDLEKTETRLRYRSVNNETARNQLYQADIELKNSPELSSEVEITEPQKIHDAFYLQGGFLLNKTDALPVHAKNDDGFIICSREKVGSKGSIILTRINLKGNAKWSFNTNLTEFVDWIYTGNRLIFFGNDNSNISSGEANLLIIIDMQTGKTVKHDYFTNAIRKDQ